MKFLYPAIFTPSKFSKSYKVEFPDLKGCKTKGDNFLEAFENAIYVASEYLSDLISNGEEPPPPTMSFHVADCIHTSFINFVYLDVPTSPQEDRCTYN